MKGAWVATPLNDIKRQWTARELAREFLYATYDAILAKGPRERGQPLVHTAALQLQVSRG